MDFLGVGFAELIFILIIAMMVFGPRRLPEIAAKAGKIVADLRNMSQGLMTEWQREINAEVYMEELRKTKKELEEVKKDLSLAGGTVARETSDVAKTIASTNLAEEAATKVKAAGEEALTAGGSDSHSVEVPAVSDVENDPEVETEVNVTSASGPDFGVEMEEESGGSASADSTQGMTTAGEEEEPKTEKSSSTPVNASTNSKTRTSSPTKTDKVSDSQTLKSEPAVND